jgi:hypothetical protein
LDLVPVIQAYTFQNPKLESSLRELSFKTKTKYIGASMMELQMNVLLLYPCIYAWLIPLLTMPVSLGMGNNVHAACMGAGHNNVLHSAKRNLKRLF